MIKCVKFHMIKFHIIPSIFNYYKNSKNCNTFILLNLKHFVEHILIMGAVTKEKCPQLDLQTLTPLNLYLLLAGIAGCKLYLCNNIQQAKLLTNIKHLY